LGTLLPIETMTSDGLAFERHAAEVSTNSLLINTPPHANLFFIQMAIFHGHWPGFTSVPPMTRELADCESPHRSVCR